MPGGGSVSQSALSLCWLCWLCREEIPALTKTRWLDQQLSLRQCPYPIQRIEFTHAGDAGQLQGAARDEGPAQTHGRQLADSLPSGGELILLHPGRKGGLQVYHSIRSGEGLFVCCLVLAG